MLVAKTVLLLIAAGFATAAEPAEVTPTPLFPVFNKFAENEIAADGKYSGKTIAVSDWGQYESKLEKQEDGTYLWVWQWGTRSDVDLTPVYGAECQLSSEGAKQFGALAPRDRSKMVLVGTLKGTKKSKRNVLHGFVLVLTDCHFEKKQK